MILQTKRLKDTLKSLGIKARVRTPYNRKFQGYEKAYSVVEKIDTEIATKLQALGYEVTHVGNHTIIEG
jgi:hypothetical protein